MIDKPISSSPPLERIETLKENVVDWIVNQ